jgi:hypothetical protein
VSIDISSGVSRIQTSRAFEFLPQHL